MRLRSTSYDTASLVDWDADWPARAPPTSLPPPSSLGLGRITSNENPGSTMHPRRFMCDQTCWTLQMPSRPMLALHCALTLAFSPNQRQSLGVGWQQQRHAETGSREGKGGDSSTCEALPPLPMATRRPGAPGQLQSSLHAGFLKRGLGPWKGRLCKLVAHRLGQTLAPQVPTHPSESNSKRRAGWAAIA